MLVCVETRPLLATILELHHVVCEVSGPVQAVSIRSGITSGDVILMEGDDYIGHCVNVAARLCDLAQGGEALADPSVMTELPRSGQFPRPQGHFVAWRGESRPRHEHRHGRPRGGSPLRSDLWPSDVHRHGGGDRPRRSGRSGAVLLAELPRYLAAKAGGLGLGPGPRRYLNRLASGRSGVRRRSTWPGGGGRRWRWSTARDGVGTPRSPRRRSGRPRGARPLWRCPPGRGRPGSPTSTGRPGTAGGTGRSGSARPRRRNRAPVGCAGASTRPAPRPSRRRARGDTGIAGTRCRRTVGRSPLTPAIPW